MNSRFSGASLMTSSTSENTNGKLSFVQFSTALSARPRRATGINWTCEAEETVAGSRSLTGMAREHVVSDKSDHLV
jgi:hypothetical protein